MIDLRLRDWNAAITLDRQHNPDGDRGIEYRPKHRSRRRWGWRLVALGGIVLLAGGLSLGRTDNIHKAADLGGRRA